MSFASTWPTAKADGENSNNTAPPEGVYEVLLKGGRAFVSKNGNEVVALEFEVVSAQENGYEWTELRSFGTQQAATAAKTTCHRLGVDTDTVASLEELDTALKERVGAYYEVDVVRKGDYLNTYVNGPTNAGVSQVPEQETVAVPAPATPAQSTFTDDDIPF